MWSYPCGVKTHHILELSFGVFPKTFSVIYVDVRDGINKAFHHGLPLNGYWMHQRLFFQYFLYNFRQSEYVLVPSFIHFSIRWISVFSDISNTKKPILSSLSQSPKTHPSLETLPLLYLRFIIKDSSISTVGRCPWCNSYRRRKWTRRYEFKSWTRLIEYHIALIPLGKVWIQLFSLQL